MSKVTHALSAVAGCAVGFLAMAVVYADCFWRTCEDEHRGRGFECSRCHSRTEYMASTPFRFCPMCGAFVVRRERI